MKSLSWMLVKLEEHEMSKKFLAFDVGGTTIKYAVIDVEIPVAELAYFDNQSEKHLEHIEYQFQLDILGETSEINLKLN